ncbi:MAG TPA: class F sortase [Amycolatopsis sp.]|nr:class F sortase [Amycolatopsis sp.]
MKRLLLPLLGLALLGGCAAQQSQAPGPLATTSGSAQAQPPSPVAVDIPKIQVHSTLVALGLNPDGTIEVPPVSRPWQAGWYRYGPVPGQPGPAVVLGHVDGNHQPGAFFHLKETVPGDKITISRSDGSVLRFVVTHVDQVAKDHFPTADVYGDTAGAQLRLITCGGVFDRAARSYEDNVIVYAALG